MNLLVLDDDPLIHSAVRSVLGSGYKLFFALSIPEAKRLLESSEVDGAIIDIRLGDGNKSGTEFLRHFRELYPDKPVLMQSGANDIPTVVQCMREGADDYLEKPYTPDALKLKVNKVLGDSQNNRVLRRAFERSQSAYQIVGTSSALLRAKSLIERAGRMRILVTGETGVGKTPFAWYSNQVVSRTEGRVRPFEQLNCSCLSLEQFQDQMFGHKKGAFTNALFDKRGLVELARGGDLFLDEIGEMSLEVQAMFLTFLDTMEYYRLGDDQKRNADVRIISATNRKLKQRIAEGNFRKDLYSRIAQVAVEIPPLRDRKEDIAAIFEHYVRKFCGFPKPYAEETISFLQSYSWEEGNVRELRDAVEYACMVSRTAERIELLHFSEFYRPSINNELEFDLELTAFNIDKVSEYGFEPYIEAFEKAVLVHSLDHKQGTIDSLADKLKLPRATFYRRLNKHGIIPAVHRNIRE